jgi:hypothetical protein
MRCLYKFTSVGEMAALVCYAKMYSTAIFVVSGVLAAAAAAHATGNL